jgi:arabinogalactan endo-1,4-beta-galactosidase
MQSLSSAGVQLSIVSLGNEIRNGMLWPLGEVDPWASSESERISSFSNFATLYAAARNGVRDAVSAGVSQPQVMIHIDNGWDTQLQLNWFGALIGTGKVSTSDWDVFGFSFYPFYGTSATLSNLQTTLNTIANKYGKPVHVVETDWPNQCSGSDAPQLSDTSVPVSASGQSEWVHDIVNVLKQVPNGLGMFSFIQLHSARLTNHRTGQGFSYWEPAWLNNTGLGSACQSAILFDADWSEYPKVTAYSLESAKMFADI